MTDSSKALPGGTPPAYWQAMSQLRFGSYYGHVTERYQCSGFLLSELRHSCARRLPEHAHEGAYFSLLLGGSYREDAQGRKLNYANFATGYHPAGMAHRDEIGNDGGWFFNIELEKSLADRLPRDPVIVEGPPLALRLFSDFKAGTLSPITVESIVYDLIGEAGRHSVQKEDSMPHWLRRATQTLRDDPAFSHSVRGLAHDAGVHPVHFARVFRARFGYPISDYLHSLRLQIAIRELSNPEVSIADIACTTGFSDQSHLTRVFKRWVGMPPAAFRKQWMQLSHEYRPLPL